MSGSDPPALGRSAQPALHSRWIVFVRVGRDLIAERFTSTGSPRMLSSAIYIRSASSAASNARIAMRRFFAHKLGKPEMELRLRVSSVFAASISRRKSSLKLALMVVSHLDHFSPAHQFARATARDWRPYAQQNPDREARARVAETE